MIRSWSVRERFGETARLLGFFALLAAALLSAAPGGAEAPPASAIRILVVKTEAAARDAVAAFQAGVPFDRLVRERSTGPERERGGYLGQTDPAVLSPEARAALAGTPPGRLSPIFRTENGFAVIQVLTEREAQALEARFRQEPEALELLRRGTELGRAGDLEGAITLLTRAVSLSPDLIDAYYNLGIAQAKLGRPDAAIAAMREVLRRHPDDFDGLLRLGGFLFDRRLYAEAIEMFERAAALQVDSLEVWRRLAQGYESAGKTQAAVAAYRRVIGLLGRDDPIMDEALLRVAMRAKDGPVAVEAARKLRASRPGHDGFVTMGEALLLNGDAEAALGEFRMAAALAPSSARAQAGLGQAYLKLGQAEPAAESLLRAVQLDPKNPARYQELAQVYEGMGRPDLAIVALRDGVSAAAPASPALQAELADQLAALYDRAGMSREAARERQRADSLRKP